MRPDAASGKPSGAFVWKKRFAVTIFPDTAKRETLCTAFCSWQEQSSCVPGEQLPLSIGATFRAAPSGTFSSLPPLLPAALSEKPYVLPHTAGQRSRWPAVFFGHFERDPKLWHNALKN